MKPTNQEPSFASDAFNIFDIIKPIITISAFRTVGDLVSPNHANRQILLVAQLQPPIAPLEFLIGNLLTTWGILAALAGVQDVTQIIDIIFVSTREDD